MRPRCRAGLISAIYIGLVIEAIPTPNPPIIRNMTNSVSVCAIAEPSAEIRKRRAAKIRVVLRPARSLNIPARGTPRKQPTKAELAAHPIIAGES